MAADTVKSPSITVLDQVAQSLSAPLTEGAGAKGVLKNHSDFVVATSGGLVQTTSTYKMVRLHSQTTLKGGEIYTKAGLDSSTGLAVDLGAYYSDSTEDGTPYSLQGTLISANCFVAAVAFAQSSAGQKIDAMSNLDANLRNSPLWAQVGLTADPGGYIDIVLAVHTIASGTAAGGNIGINLSMIN
jgi:hypothetical protein